MKVRNRQHNEGIELLTRCTATHARSHILSCPLLSNITNITYLTSVKTMYVLVQLIYIIKTLHLNKKQKPWEPHVAILPGVGKVCPSSCCQFILFYESNLR